MRRRLVLSYVGVAVLILIALEVPLGIIYGRHEHDVASVGLQRDAAAIASLADDAVDTRNVADLTTLADHYRTAGEDDVEIVAADGTVLVPARSDEGELATGMVGSRVKELLAGGADGVTHLGDGDELFAVAPVGDTVPPTGVVIATAPDSVTNRRVEEAWLGLALLALGAVAAAAGLGFVVANSVTGPLVALEGAAERLGGGDLSARAAERGPEELRALAHTFNSMAARLEDLVAAQGRFVADASHQLRSPLTALRLRLENIAADTDRVDPTEIGAVQGEMDRLSRIVDGLLGLARAEGERPAREVVDVSAAVVERVDSWSALAEEAGVALSADVVPARAALGPGHLEQILDNLLANALEATPAGGTVRLVVRSEGGRVVVHVIDNGRGMSEEDRAHAFDRLWRGTESRPGAGSGLGLAIVHQLARANGAGVELAVADGAGVDAVVTIDAAPPAGGWRPPSGDGLGPAVRPSPGRPPPL